MQKTLRAATLALGAFSPALPEPQAPALLLAGLAALFAVARRGSSRTG